jgi:hypothetical protein
MREQRDLVGGLDAAGLEEHLLAVDDGEILLLQRHEHRHLGDVDADGLVLQAVLGQHPGDLARDVVGDAGAGVERAPQRRDARPRTVGAVEPRVVELVVAGGGAEVPDDGIAAAGEQREPDELVDRPRPDVRGRHVPDVGEVEGQQGAQLGPVERGPQPLEPLAAQPVVVDAFFPVDRVGSVGAYRHCAGTSSARSPRRSAPARTCSTTLTI